MDPSKKRAEDVLRQKHQYAKRKKEETPQQREERLNRTREYARKRREDNPPTREELDEKKRKAAEKRRKIKEETKTVNMHLNLTEALDMYESAGKRNDRLQFGLTKVEHKQFDNFMDMLDNPKYVGLENVTIPEDVYDDVVRMVHTLDGGRQLGHLFV